LKRLVEHIWKVIGVASTCKTMPELRRKMQELYGKAPGFHFELKLVGDRRRDPPVGSEIEDYRQYQRWS
jgi:hypothetical protein